MILTHRRTYPCEAIEAPVEKTGLECMYKLAASISQKQAKIVRSLEIMNAPRVQWRGSKGTGRKSCHAKTKLVKLKGSMCNVTRTCLEGPSDSPWRDAHEPEEPLHKRQLIRRDLVRLMTKLLSGCVRSKYRNPSRTTNPRTTPEAFVSGAFSVCVLAMSAKARLKTKLKAVALHTVDLRLRAAKANMRDLETRSRSMSQPFLNSIKYL